MKKYMEKTLKVYIVSSPLAHPAAAQKTKKSFLENFPNIDIQIIKETKSGIGKAAMFSLPFLSGFKGICLGVMEGYRCTKRIKDLLYELKPLDPFVCGLNGDATAWDCSHVTSTEIYSAQNLADVFASPTNYLKKIEGDDASGSCRTSSYNSAWFDFSKYLTPSPKRQ